MSRAQIGEGDGSESLLWQSWPAAFLFTLVHYIDRPERRAQNDR